MSWKSWMVSAGLKAEADRSLDDCCSSLLRMCWSTSRKRPSCCGTGLSAINWVRKVSKPRCRRRSVDNEKLKKNFFEGMSGMDGIRCFRSAWKV